MFSPSVHRILFLFGCCSLAFGMMVGTVPTSVPQFILLGNWILEMDLRRKWNSLKGNLLFWILSSGFLIHVLGLLYTSNLQAGWDDVRTKIPMMFLPMIFLTSPALTKRDLHLVLLCFLLGSIINTAWSYLYTFVLHKNEVVRSASRFMSHIRLGLYLNVAIACCLYFIGEFKNPGRRLLFIALILYFLFCMYALGLASGLMNFVLLCLITVLYFAWKQKLIVRLGLLLALLGGVVLVGEYIYRVYSSQFASSQCAGNSMLEKTKSGRMYLHVPDERKENGCYVTYNLQMEELKNEWNRRNPDDTFSYRPKTNINRYHVLIRYLASRGMTKDSASLSSLSAEDIANIRNNITNYRLPQWSYLHKRIYELVNEYDELSNNRTVNGHSLSMRLYFWKTAVYLISKNFLTGVGTGDVQVEMNKVYRESNVPLEEEWYKRPHNQFLTVTVALGVFGLFIFVLCVFYPAISLRKTLHILYWPFFILAVISFFVEDTLETQAGQTYFSFFNALFVSIAYFDVRRNGDKVKS